MGKLTIALVLVFILLVVGGGVFLAVWNPPPPSARIEKVLPNDRFPK